MKNCEYCHRTIAESVGGWGINEDILTGEKTYFHVECAEMNEGVLQYEA